jgi:hypothetical protein
VAAEHAAELASLKQQLAVAQKAAKRLSERQQAAAGAAGAAERQRDEAEQQLEAARVQLSKQHQALAGAREALAAREAEAAAAAANAAASAAASHQALLADRARLEGRLQEVQEQARSQHEKHALEMQVGVLGLCACTGPCCCRALLNIRVVCRARARCLVCVWVPQHVELRVKAAIARKDEQLASALEALHRTEAVLAAQQEELCS